MGWGREWGVVTSDRCMLPGFSAAVNRSMLTIGLSVQRSHSDFEESLYTYIISKTINRQI